jgi:hypothetical protein
LNGKTAVLAQSLGPQFQKYLACEVLYVGQAFGENGSRTAPDRLESHSTLQEIYSDACSRAPDKEIWFCLWNFDPWLLVSFDGRQQEYGTSTEVDSEHIDTVLNTDITEEQRINFTEAALIRYFQPEYNVIYKDSFPSPKHTDYSECYNLDVNSVAVELNTEESKVILWSEAVSPRWIHFIQYALHNKEERKAMFDFLL